MDPLRGVLVVSGGKWYVAPVWSRPRVWRTERPRVSRPDIEDASAHVPVAKSSVTPATPKGRSMSDSGTTTSTEPDDLAQLREKAGQVDTEKGRADAAERRLAMYEADVDLTSDVGKFFAQHYDGDLSVEALKEAAGKVGALKSTTPPEKDPETTVPDDEAEARRKAQLGLTVGGVPGAQPPEKPDPDPIEKAYDKFNADVEGGMAMDTAAGGVIDALFRAATEGDKRVIYDPERDRGLTRRKIKTPGNGL